MHFELVHVGDPRSLGGSSAALRGDLAAAAAWGVDVAVLPMIGPSAGPPLRRFEPRTARVIDRPGVTWIDGSEPATCDLLLAHHPFLFEHMPSRPLRVRPKRLVCVVHHPPFDAFGQPEYDLARVEAVLGSVFGVPPVFAPVGPKVRRQFHALGRAAPPVAAHDLANVIDLAEWPYRERPHPRRTMVIGRHARNDPRKWPDTRSDFLEAYPPSEHVRYRNLGGVPERVQPWITPDWTDVPFGTDGVPAFLDGLDAWVYVHSRGWVEAFGLAIAEALATGLPTIVGPDYEPLFEDGAVYAEPAAIPAVVERLRASPGLWRRQSAAARGVVERRFSFAAWPDRMRRLCDDVDAPLPRALAGVGLLATRPRAMPPHPVARPDPPDPPGLPARRVRRRRVLFVATNGIGLGHVTRLMAIAERLSRDIEPVFFTLSLGSALVAARGHAVDYTPSDAKLAADGETWNRVYAEDVLAAVEEFDAAGVVFDSNYPFQGLMDVAVRRRDIAWVWVRRGLWTPGHELDPAMQRAFDMVIEPGEIAAGEDGGATASMPEPIVRVPPILLCDPASALPRDEAARRLGVDPARPVALVQLGSQQNFAFSALESELVDALVARGVQVVDVDNPLAAQRPSRRADVRRVRIYPLAECLPAADLVVTNAGYNSFHECILGGCSTIFVPNEAPGMDDQILRASFAESAGLGQRLRHVEAHRVADVVERGLSADFAAEVIRRSAQLPQATGAAEAARAIEELVFSARADRPLSVVVPRI